MGCGASAQRSFAGEGQGRRVQFIAFEICTMPQGFDTKQTTDDDFYLGVAGNLAEDLNLRAALMRDAMMAALACEDVDKSSTTLKVFVAPEFYWRGPQGAYDVDELFEMLRKQTFTYSQPRFADWLFLFGTMVGREQVDGSEEDFIIYNLAPVTEEGNKSITAVLKEYKSKTDFLRDPKLGGLASGNARHFQANAEMIKIPHDLTDTYSIDEDGIFTEHGIIFGVEICLDHTKKCLRNTQGSDRVQVQLVTSAGMKVQQGSVCVCDGGFVFHCDGITDGSYSVYGGHSSAFIREGGQLTRQEPICRNALFGETWRERLTGLYVNNHSQPAIAVYPSLLLPDRA